MRAAAIAYAAVTAVIVGFQVALALGAPWGAYAMGGAFPGRYPPALRTAAVVQALVLAALAGLVLSRAGIAFPRWARTSRRLIWIAVVIAAASFLMNLITPSAVERAIWAPTALVLLVSSLTVALRA